MDITRGPTVGVLSPLLGDEFFGKLVLGIHRTVRRHGGRTIGIQTAPHWQQGGAGPGRAGLVPYALDHLDAVIAVLHAATAGELRRIRDSGRPVVTICATYTELGIPAVYPENGPAVKALVRHLASHGHRRIGFAGCLANDDARERYEAYRAALLEEGIDPDPTLLFEAPDMRGSGGQVAAERLLAAGMPCTAICASTDDHALAIMERVQQAGYRIPDDLAVVGFDDLQLSAASRPSLTTVHQYNDRLGAVAAELVLAQLAGEEVAPRKVLVPSPPVYRQSCGCWTFGMAVPAEGGRSPASGERAGAGRDAVLREALLWETLGPQGERDADHGAALDAAGRIARALCAVMEGRPPPPPGALSAAWREVCAAVPSIEAVSRAFGALRRTVEQQLEAAGAGAAARASATALLDELRSELIYAARQPFVTRALNFEGINHRNYRTSMQLLAPRDNSVRDLDWLAETFAAAGCLGLWPDGATGSALTVAGVYPTTHPRALGATCAPAAFPPLRLFEPAMQANPDLLLMVLPLQTAEHDWGALALLSPVEMQALTPDAGVWQWTGPLMAALAREHLALEREGLRRMLDESERQRVRLALERERVEKEAYRATAARLEELNRELAEMDRLKTELLEQSRAQAAAAEELARLRSSFVATVSHELRTPLAAIIGYAELLEGQWDLFDDAMRRQRVGRIVLAANRQRRLVEELLLLSGLEMGAVAPVLETVAIAGLVDRAADEVRTSYRGQRVDLLGPRDLAVLADAERTVQILVNIIDNAAKYSPEGAPVEVEWRSEGGQVVMRIRDHGVGLPPEGRDRLFTRFGRMPGSRTRAGRVGTGLGLYLGRSLAQAMGGDLDLECTGPGGSTFRLRLPLAPAT